MNTYYSNWKNDKDFLELFKKFNAIHNIDNDIESPMYSRLYVLRQLAKQQSKKNACFAEAGVYAGMSMFFTADLCNTKFIGIDSFEGVSEPLEFDTDYFKTVKLVIPMSFAEISLNGFQNTLLYKGWIPEAFNMLEENNYSYVHIDVDLWKPTKTSIEYFWPRLIDGGVLICDDYGSNKTIGARKAMDDFFGKDNILELPTGQGIVFKGIDLEQ